MSKRKQFSMKTSILLLAAAATGLSFTIHHKLDSENTLGSSIAELSGENMAPSDYRVIKVSGRIVYAKNGSDMHQGDIFSPNDGLNFKSQTSRAAVISKANGRKILSPKNGSKDKATLLPPINNISSRSGGLNNLIDLKNHFTGKYLILGESHLKISEKSFPMNDGAFFYLRYQYEGETINKKLSHDGDKLILNKEEIYKIDGEAIDVSKVDQVDLFYRSGNTSSEINTFAPVFPEDGELKTELEIIMMEIEDLEEEKQLAELTSYLNEYYGKPHKDNLKVWVAEHLK